MTVPSRASPPFASTLSVTVPLPVPFDPAAILIHAAALAAVHPQPGALAPAAGTDVIELVSATEHLLPVGEVTEIEDEPQLETRYASASNPSGLATTDERCCRALMRAAQGARALPGIVLLIH